MIRTQSTVMLCVCVLTSSKYNPGKGADMYRHFFIGNRSEIQMDIVQIVKEIESETKEALVEKMVGKKFADGEFPNELMQLTTEIIVNSVLSNLSTQSFNLKPIRQGHIFLITATDEFDNTVVDVMYITRYENENPLDFEIEDVNVAVKEYVFKKAVEEIEAEKNKDKELNQ